jgi:hypothetical protein
MLPLIVFAIATHMMLHPDPDLIDVLAGEKTLSRFTAGRGCGMWQSMKERRACVESSESSGMTITGHR